jgi:hypothetical protein
MFKVDPMPDWSALDPPVPKLRLFKMSIVLEASALAQNEKVTV